MFVTKFGRNSARHQIRWRAAKKNGKAGFRIFVAVGMNGLVMLRIGG
jgi:hypothetical protein